MHRHFGLVQFIKNSAGYNKTLGYDVAHGRVRPSGWGNGFNDLENSALKLSIHSIDCAPL